MLSSVKTDLADETFGWRSTRGECRVFDPVGITGLPTASWSPLRGAATVDGAQAAARALVDCAPRSGMDDGAFWYQQAEIVLAGYLWVASTHRPRHARRRPLGVHPGRPQRVSVPARCNRC